MRRAILWLLRYVVSLPTKTWFIVTTTTLFYLFLVAVVDVVMSGALGPVMGHVVSTFAAIVLCPFWLAAMAFRGTPR